MRLKSTILSMVAGLALTSGLLPASPAGASSLGQSDETVKVAEGNVVIDGAEMPSDDVPDEKDADEKKVSNASSEPEKACGWTQFVAPGTGKWYKSNKGCALIGTTKSTTATYTWAGDPATKGTACVQGLGYNGSQKAKWVFIGCGSGGTKTVGWGNVSAVKKVRAKGTNLPSTFFGRFR